MMPGRPVALVSVIHSPAMPMTINCTSPSSKLAEGGVVQGAGVEIFQRCLADLLFDRRDLQRPGQEQKETEAEAGGQNRGPSSAFLHRILSTRLEFGMDYTPIVKKRLEKAYYTIKDTRLSVVRNSAGYLVLLIFRGHGSPCPYAFWPGSENQDHVGRRWRVVKWIVDEGDLGAARG